MTLTRVLFLFSLALGPALASAQGQPASAPAASPPAAPAQSPGTAIAAELRIVAEGWALLAQGDFARAAAKAGQAIKAAPRHPAAVWLALEVELAKDSRTGLDYYDRWLGQRTLEEPAMLRRISTASLREEASQRQEPAARLEALRGLAEDGDPRAADELRAFGSQPGIAGTHALAAQGDERSVKALIDSLSGPSVDVRTLTALGSSGRPEAVAPIADLLADTRQEIRGFAAEALGKLGQRDVAPRLTPLLSDRSIWVRAKAAGALYRLGDSAGQATLQELAADASPELKLLAAEGMAVRPDASWLALVKELAASPNPQISTAAARLIGPHDPELARAVLEPLMSNENGAIRELASQALGEATTSDLTLLRRLLRSPARLTRIRAAVRVLVLTR
jgi:HEAT repeat protein